MKKNISIVLYVISLILFFAAVGLFFYRPGNYAGKIIIEALRFISHISSIICIWISTLFKWEGKYMMIKRSNIVGILNIIFFVLGFFW